MIQINNTSVSKTIIKQPFACDLSLCKGVCCVYGDSGAPLKNSEADILEHTYPLIKPYLSPVSITEINEQGIWVIDSDGDKVTPLIQGEECAYSYKDSAGINKCAIETAYFEGIINFRKPVSCHLYPIRIKEKSNFLYVEYHKWKYCKPALDLGNQKNIPLYVFAKDALLRYFGKEWYARLESLAKKL